MPAAPSSLPFLALAIFSGVSFGIIPFAYRLGQRHALSTTHVFSIGATGGLLFFLCKFFVSDGGSPAAMPPYVWITGLVVGFLQYFAIKSSHIALMRGPLTPVWCAVTLSFLPGVAYAAIVCGERLGAMECAGILMGVAAVMVTAIQQAPRGHNEAGRLNAKPTSLNSEAEAPPRSQHRLAGVAAYALLLLVMLISNGTPLMGVKELARHSATLAADADGAARVTLHQDFMWVLLYAMLAAGLWLDLLVTRSLKVALRPALSLGLLSAIGSVGGIWALGVSGQRLPGAVAFTAMCCAQILTVAIVSVACFRERRTAWWYATLGLSGLAVLLVNLVGMRQFLAGGS